MHINIHESNIPLSQLVERVVAGEDIILDSNGKSVAKIVPVQSVSKAPRQLGIWRGKVRIADDFDELPPELARAFGIEIDSASEGRRVDSCNS